MLERCSREWPYTIRPAIDTDLDVLLEFTRREAAEAEGLTLSGEAMARGVRAGFETPPLSRYWVAEAATTVVASISVVTEWSNFHGGDYWWIQSLYIEPEHRGTGLLEALIEQVSTAARVAGALDLRLYVHGANERAMRAYRRCGFVAAPYLIMSRRTGG